MRTLEFLTAERDHAERHLARIRRIQAKMNCDLEATGLNELKVYEALIANKAYRQLQRDESFYQQMWLRIGRHLDKLPQPAAPQPTAPPPIQIAKPQTVRYTTPKPGRNQLCPCGSTIKYKRCCGNPLKQPPGPGTQRPAA